MSPEPLEEVRKRNLRKVSIEQSKVMVWLRRHTNASETDLKAHLARYAEVAYSAGLDMGRTEARWSANEVWHQNKLMKGLAFALVAMLVGAVTLLLWR